MKIAEMYPGQFLTAADFSGGKVAYPTIKGVSVLQIDGEKKWVMTFHNTEKSLVLNKTNAARIGEWHGDNTDNWIGKQIGLHAEPVQYRDRTVMGIRVVCPTNPSDRMAENPKRQSASSPPTQIAEEEIPF